MTGVQTCALPILGGWRAFISNAKDLPKSIGNALCQRVEDVIIFLEDRQEKLKLKLNRTITSINSATTLKDILVLEKELYSLERQDYVGEMKNVLESGLETVMYIKNAIECLPLLLDDLKKIEIDNYDMGNRIIGNEIIKMIEQAERKQKIWIENNIVIVEKNSSQMDAMACTDWLEKTKILPEYLSIDIIDRYKKIYRIVEGRLRECKIDGVVSLFNKLDSEEKQQCLEILLKNKFE